MLKRKFRLELSGGVSKVIEDLRIDFQYREGFGSQGITNMADWCDIEIYNLSLDSFKAIATAEEVQVKLYTGYYGADALDLTFYGVIRNTAGLRKLPNHITTIYCIPVGRFNAEKKVKYSGNEEDTVRTVLEEVATQLGMTFDPTNIDEAVLNKPYINKSIHDVGTVVLGDIGRENEMLFLAKEGVIRGIPKPQANKIDSTSKTVILDATKLRGTPKAGVQTLDIMYALDTSINTGDVVDASKINNTDDKAPNGIVSVAGIKKSALHYDSTITDWAMKSKYQIFEIMHHGSNYTSDFVSELSCRYYNPTGTGGS